MLGGLLLFGHFGHEGKVAVIERNGAPLLGLFRRNSFDGFLFVGLDLPSATLGQRLHDIICLRSVLRGIMSEDQVQAHREGQQHHAHGPQRFLALFGLRIGCLLFRIVVFVVSHNLRVQRLNMFDMQAADIPRDHAEVHGREHGEHRQYDPKPLPRRTGVEIMPEPTCEERPHAS